MNRTTRHLTRLTGLAFAMVALVLATAGQASAMRPEPTPAGPDSGPHGLVTSSVLRVTDSSVSALQWALFAAAVVAAFAIGAALMHLAQRRHVQFAH